MASNTDRDDRFNGIEVLLPFFAIRLGQGRRGSGMGPAFWDWDSEMRNDDDDYKRARRRVRARLAYYRHLVTYIAVIAGLLLIDALTGDGFGWSLWVAGIWGAFVVWRGLSTFVFPTVWSRETEERMIEEELHRQRRA